MMSFNAAAYLELNHALEWGKWFAWYPVKVHNKWTWLTTVYRRQFVISRDWQYGTIFDVLISPDLMPTPFARALRL